MHAARFVAEARLDLWRVVLRYEEQRRGLGFDFLLAFKSTIESMRLHPASRQVIAKATRRALLRRFPYFVLYIANKDEVLITALFHCRRDPLSWSNRVGEPVNTEYVGRAYPS